MGGLGRESKKDEFLPEYWYKIFRLDMVTGCFGHRMKKMLFSTQGLANFMGRNQRKSGFLPKSQCYTLISYYLLVDFGQNLRKMFAYAQTLA